MDPYGSTDALLSAIDFEGGGFAEVSRVTTVHADRRRDDGSTHRVRIEIHDHGESAGAGRWTVTATDLTDECAATGAPHDSLHEALAAVPWADLERPA